MIKVNRDPFKNLTYKLSLYGEQSAHAISIRITTIRLKNESSQGRGNIMKRNFGKTTGRRLWKYDSRDDNRRVYRVG